jgi:transposase
MDTFWLSYESVQMPRTRNPYPAEFRAQIVALAQAGRSVEELAREFEPCAATIHGWVKQAERDGGRRADLRMERDILSKAAAWFAQNDVTSSRSTNS